MLAAQLLRRPRGAKELHWQVGHDIERDTEYGKPVAPVDLAGIVTIERLQGNLYGIQVCFHQDCRLDYAEPASAD